MPKIYTDEDRKLLSSRDYLYCCKKCNILKPNSEYHAKVRGKIIRPYNSVCKVCQSEYSKSREKVCKERRREQKLKWNFGLTLEQYNALLNNQNHKCAICGIPQVNLNRNFDVDHDHETGKVRALLCHNCNVAIGLMKENINIMENAIDYLKSHQNIPMVL